MTEATCLVSSRQRIARALRLGAVPVAAGLGLRLGAVPVAAGLGLWLGARGPAVGRFRSPAAKAKYLRAYDRAMTDLPMPDRTLDVPTRFGTARLYRFDGARDDAPLVLLQGQSSATPAWGDTLPALLHLRTVYAVDLLGQPGRSAQDTPLVSSEDHAAWVRDVLDALPEVRFHLVGLSIGGWNAMNLAAQDPAAIASLTLLDSPLVVGPLSTDTILRSVPVMLPGAPQSWRVSPTGNADRTGPGRDRSADALHRGGGIDHSQTAGRRGARAPSAASRHRPRLRWRVPRDILRADGDLAAFLRSVDQSEEGSPP